MARTLTYKTRTHKMHTRSGYKPRQSNPNIVAHNALFKAAAVDHILTNWYITLNRVVTDDNDVLRRRILEQATANQSQHRTITRLNTLNGMQARMIRTLEEENNDLNASLEISDRVIHQIFTDHPTLAWRYREQINYSDINLAPPLDHDEEANDLAARHLFGSDTDSESLDDWEYAHRDA
uniref:Uncharacterized protein n=1 Tax=Phoenicopteridae parvo-like hybrid virus TaxID=2794528 RepID=A0A8A4XDR5_9VIRU|nr:MAG: hypothetical protein [Phoenicopteridae parvo-like hybrid virus]